MRLRWVRVRVAVIHLDLNHPRGPLSGNGQAIGALAGEIRAWGPAVKVVVPMDLVPAPVARVVVRAVALKVGKGASETWTCRIPRHGPAWIR